MYCCRYVAVNCIGAETGAVKAVDTTVAIAVNTAAAVTVHIAVTVVVVAIAAAAAAVVAAAGKLERTVIGGRHVLEVYNNKKSCIIEREAV